MQILQQHARKLGLILRRSSTSYKPRLISSNTLALGSLRWEKKRLDQLTIAANRHSGESLVPLALGYLRLAIQPLGQKF
jgi:hypothetical protein